MQVASGGAMRRDHSSDGVYERVKVRVLEQEFPAGKRIRPEPLGDRLFVSYTPVREALIELAAERLINEVPGVGFFAKELSAPEITGLYKLQGMILEWSLSDSGERGRPRHRLEPPKFIRDVSEGVGMPPRTAVGVMDDLAVHISSQSGNGAVIPIVRNINDRTHYIRLKDYEKFGDADHLLPKLCEDFCQKNANGLRDGLKSLYRERLARLSDLIRILKMERN